MYRIRLLCMAACLVVSACYATTTRPDRDATMAVNASRADACCRQAQDLCDDHRLTDAEAAYRNALTLDYNCKPALIGLASVLLAEHRDTEANGLLMQALTPMPQDPVLLVRLAKLLHEEAKHDLALEALHHAVEVAPRNVEAWSLIGEICSGGYHPPEAITAFRRALTLRPDDPALTVSLGNALLDAHLGSEAFQLLNEAVQHHPENSGLRKVYLKAVAGSRKQPEALAEARTWANAHPDVPDYHTLEQQLATMVEATKPSPTPTPKPTAKATPLNEMKKRVTDLQAQVNKRPQDRALRVKLLTALYELPDWHPLFQGYRQAVKAFPKDVAFWQGLAEVAEFLEQPFDAAEARRKALALNPTLALTWGARQLGILKEPKRPDGVIIR